LTAGFARSLSNLPLIERAHWKAILGESCEPSWILSDNGVTAQVHDHSFLMIFNFFNALILNGKLIGLCLNRTAT
jgi:hypothetical protein